MAPLSEGFSPLITPILRKPHTDAGGTEDNAEARMRQALGKLGTARPGRPEAPHRANAYHVKPGAGRHRFRQDGEVPVVRISLTVGGRGMERQSPAPVESMGARHGQAGEGREQGSSDTIRQVQELTEQLLATQTRLGHAELALQEAGREAQGRQEKAAGLRRALDAVEAILAQVRAELAASERVRKDLERSRCAKHHPDPEVDGREDTATRRKVGRPLGSSDRFRNHAPASEPEPVKWWVGD